MTTLIERDFHKIHYLWGEGSCSGFFVEIQIELQKGKSKKQRSNLDDTIPGNFLDSEKSSVNA